MIHEDEFQNELMDRLVDGELPEGEYRHVIRRLEDSPDGWRRCALSFLEQQALQRELKQLLKDGVPLEIADDPLDEFETDELESGTLSTRGRWEDWLGKPWVRWTSVLAVGVLAFVGGIALQPFGSNNSRPSDPTAGIASIPRAIDPMPTQPISGATLLVEDSFAGQPKSLTVPIIPASGWKGIPSFAPNNIPPEIASALGDPRFMERQYVIVRDVDGTVFIMAMDLIRQSDNFD